MTTAIRVTLEHIARVRYYLDDFRIGLYNRGVFHDQSKLLPVEAGPLQEMQDLIDREGPAPYGTEEYKRRTALLGPMLEHHYKVNSHHPEHYKDGMAGMDLLDLVEMVCDWKAAAERGGDDAVNLTYSFEKYGVPPMLQSIITNHFDRKGWATK